MFISLDDPSFVGSESLAEWRERAAEVGARLSTLVLGPDENDMSAPAAFFAHLPPNWVFARHAHKAFRLEIIVRGTITANGKQLGPGDIMVTQPGEAYGPHYVGPEGALTVEIFGRADGIEPLTEDGSLAYDDFTRANTSTT